MTEEKREHAWLVRRVLGRLVRNKVEDAMVIWRQVVALSLEVERLRHSLIRAAGRLTRLRGACHALYVYCVQVVSQGEVQLSSGNIGGT